MDSKSIRQKLSDLGLISPGEVVHIEYLSGGVSSNIQLVRFRNQALVFKEALTQLRVKDEWLASTSRNRYEQRFFRFMQQVQPEAIPTLRIDDPAAGYFAMDYLEGFTMWKTEMMSGLFHVERAIQSASILATIHNAGYGNVRLRNDFDSEPNFFQLRLDPYLLTTANRHPDLAAIFKSEVSRLQHTKETVVHGDYSPKNLMIKDDRMVLLDHEVAHYGDPAFDISFILTHLFLKSLLHPTNTNSWRPFITAFWTTYFKQSQHDDPEALKSRSLHLLLLLLLARVDGKSPVEYFEEGCREHGFIRSFVSKYVVQSNTFNLLQDSWLKEVKALDLIK